MKETNLKRLKPAYCTFTVDFHYNFFKEKHDNKYKTVVYRQRQSLL